MMRVEPFTLQDLVTLCPLQPDGWSDLAPVFEFYTDSEFCIPVKVTSDSVTIAVGCAIRFATSAWLAHIIVHPAYRRRGAGSLIVEHLLDQLTQFQVRTTSLIATNDGHPLYLRFGFAEEREYIFFRTTTTVPRVHRNRSFDLASPSAGDEILALDRAVSGEPREALLKPHLSEAFVVRTAGSVAGVYFPKLGEGLIEALDEDAGMELLSLRLFGTDQCVLPADNTVAAEFLRRNGFKEFRRAWRMTWGERFPWHPEWIYSRIAGNLG